MRTEGLYTVWFVQLTGKNKLCHWNGRMMGIIDNTTAERTPCVENNYIQQHKYMK